jgi:integrase/recombinase XerD
MTPSSETDFKQNYQTHLKHLKLKGLQPKTVEAYARGIRRLGEYFDYQVHELSEAQLLEYFTDLLETHSWSSVKLDLYALKFFYTYVLHKPWPALNLIKPPKAQRLPDIVTVAEAGQLFTMTHTLSYRVFFFTLYSLGLRLGEGLRLTVADIDATRQRVHIRDAKAIKTGWCRCRRRRWPACAASGKCIVIPSCCFPIATAASSRPIWPPRRWIAAGCRRRYAKWRKTAD